MRLGRADLDPKFRRKVNFIVTVTSKSYLFVSFLFFFLHSHFPFHSSEARCFVSKIMVLEGKRLHRDLISNINGALFMPSKHFSCAY